MLICHCNVISAKQIEQVILAFLQADPWQLIVPAKVYAELGKRGRCCGCFPNVVDIIAEVTEKHHLQIAAKSAERSYVLARAAASGTAGERGRHEGRSTGHRAA